MILAVLGELTRGELVGDGGLLAGAPIPVGLLGCCRRRELDLLVGDVDLPVRGRGVDEDDVAGQVEQVRRAIEDALGDLSP